LHTHRVRNLQELSTTVPNFYVAESFLGDALYIRGVGSGQNNLGFEQAVGQVIDGFFYGRSRYSRLPFLDLQRVEILKGPQGALLGKNTTAGAINSTSNKPTDQFDTWVSTAYEFEVDKGYSVEGVVSGPINDKFKGRLAIRYDDRDGYFTNTTTGADDVGVEDVMARASLVWQAADEIDVLFQYEYAELDHDGDNNQYAICDTTSDQDPGPPVQNFTSAFLASAPDDCQLNYTRSGTSAQNGVNLEGKETNFDTFNVTIDWLRGNVLLSSLTGYSQYDYREYLDGDRTSIELLVPVDSSGTIPEFAEDYQQWSQEFRITSQGSSRYAYIAGLFLMEKEQDTEYLLHFANIAGSAVSRNVLTQEEGSTYAMFGQLTKHINKQWDLTIGGRFTYEKKEVSSRQFPSDLYTFNLQACGVTAAGACLTHDVSDDFDEEDFSPSIDVQWRPNSNTMYYGSVRRGFKAGGYVHLLVANQADAQTNLRFDSEEVTAYELGAKWQLGGGTAEINTALFYNEFNDLQLGGLIGATTSNIITNAGSAISQGVELEARWRITQQFFVHVLATYLDASYEDYSDAPCNDTQGCAPGQTQDLSGKNLQFAVDKRAALALEYQWDLSKELTLTSFLLISYSSELPLQADLDPNLIQDEYVKADARLTLNDKSKDWELSLLVKNLDDEQTSYYGDDVPAQSGSYWRSIDAPRSVTLQGIFHF
ncbi:MAG: TonB-dependent receptor, partial [Pseudomonadales bacterium]